MAHNAPPFPPRYRLQLGARGRVVLPAEARKQLGLRAGDRLVLTVEPEGTIRLLSLHQQLKKARGMFRSKEPQRILSRELIQERRREAKRERLD